MIIHILCSYTIYVHIHIILNHYMSSIYVFMVYVLRHTLYICFGRVVRTGGSVRGCQIIFYCYFYLNYGLVWSGLLDTIRCASAMLDPAMLNRTSATFSVGYTVCCSKILYSICSGCCSCLPVLLPSICMLFCLPGDECLLRGRWWQSIVHITQLRARRAG